MTNENKTKITKGVKKILYEAVNESKTPQYIIIGALSKAGLLQQYNQEKEEYGIFDLKPSITIDELDKIIKKFTGE